MSQGAIVNPNRAIPRFRLNNVTPFTYRDGLTFLELIEELRHYVVSVIVPEIDEKTAALDEHLEEMHSQMVESLGEYHDLVVDSVDDFQRIHDAYMADVNASLMALNDSAVADLVGDPGSELNAALMRKRGTVSVTDFGAVMDGETDSQAAVQAAANLARDLDVPLYIPSGEVHWAGTVTAYGDIIADGTIVFDPAVESQLLIVRRATPVTFNALDIGGLTANSGMVTGLEGNVGTLELRSSERLIYRVGNDDYLKTEVCSVVNTSGGLSQPLDVGYNKPQITTARMWPLESPIELRNVSIVIRGTGSQPASQPFMNISRDDVVCHNLTITNESAVSLATALVVSYCARIRFEYPRIVGFEGPGLGYGVNLSVVDDVVFNNGTITQCRHAVAGRHTKNIVFNGGTYDGGLDTHWGNGFTLNNVTSVVSTSGIAHVMAAGSNVSIVGGTFVGGQRIFLMRTDTPELAGTVRIADLDWSPLATEDRLAIFTDTTTHEGVDFGRRLRRPDAVLIDNVRVRSASTGSVLLYGVEGSPYVMYDVGDYRRIEVSRVSFSTPIRLLAVAVRHSEFVEGAYSPQIVLRDIDFRASTGQSTLLNRVSDLPGADGFDVTIEQCQGFRGFFKEVACNSVVVRGGSVKQWVHTAPTDGVTDAAGTWVFDGVHLDAAQFNGYFRIDFRNCYWTGVSTSSYLNLDARPRSWVGNRVHVDATAPTNFEGFRNKTYLKGSSAALPVANTDTVDATYDAETAAVVNNIRQRVLQIESIMRQKGDVV